MIRSEKNRVRNERTNHAQSMRNRSFESTLQRHNSALSRKKSGGQLNLMVDVEGMEHSTENVFSDDSSDSGDNNYRPTEASTIQSSNSQPRQMPDLPICLSSIILRLEDMLTYPKILRLLKPEQREEILYLIRLCFQR